VQCPFKHGSRQEEPILGILNHLDNLLHAEAESDLVIDIEDVAGLPLALEEALVDQVDEELEEHLL